MVFAGFFAMDVPSPVTLVSMVMTAVAVGGLVVLARVAPALLFAVAGFMLIDLWFLAQHKGVYIRNCLLFVPFIALAFAAGCRWIGELSMQRASTWWAAVAAFSVVFAINVFWLFETAWVDIRVEPLRRAR